MRYNEVTYSTGIITQRKLWFGEVCHSPVLHINFCEKGVKTRARVCQTSGLEPLVKTLNHTLFKGVDVFQQNLAPAPKAKATQKWHEKNVPNFFKAFDWSSASTYLNSD